MSTTVRSTGLRTWLDTVTFQMHEGERRKTGDKQVVTVIAGKKEDDTWPFTVEVGGWKFFFLKDGLEGLGSWATTGMMWSGDGTTYATSGSLIGLGIGRKLEDLACKELGVQQ